MRAVLLRGAVGVILAGALALIGSWDKAQHQPPADSGKGWHRPATAEETLTRLLDRCIEVPDSCPVGE